MNKLAVHHLPLPGLVTACQFSLCSVFVFGGKLGGCLRMDDFEWEKAKFFIIYVLSFTIGTYTNMKVLSMANVETVIVFRSCTPLAVACFDTIFYNRQMPGARSCFALLLITGGAIAYIMSDREFQVNGAAAYYWVLIWWAVLVFQLTYGKFLVTGIPLASLWTPVLYTNTFSIIPALLVCAIAGELSEARLASVDVTTSALGWLLLSCAIGIGISWAGTQALAHHRILHYSLSLSLCHTLHEERAHWHDTSALSPSQLHSLTPLSCSSLSLSLSRLLVPIARLRDDIHRRRRHEQNAHRHCQRPHLGQACVRFRHRRALRVPPWREPVSAGAAQGEHEQCGGCRAHVGRVGR